MIGALGLNDLDSLSAANISSFKIGTARESRSTCEKIKIPFASYT